MTKLAKILNLFILMLKTEHFTSVYHPESGITTAFYREIGAKWMFEVHHVLSLVSLALIQSITHLLGGHGGVNTRHPWCWHWWCGLSTHHVLARHHSRLGPTSWGTARQLRKDLHDLIIYRQCLITELLILLSSTLGADALLPSSGRLIHDALVAHCVQALWKHLGHAVIMIELFSTIIALHRFD